MEWKAVVMFYGDLAHYKIIPEHAGIYHAHLIKYEGPSDLTPPEHITLIRGVRQWNGSYAEQDLLNELGRAIESSLGLVI